MCGLIICNFVHRWTLCTEPCKNVCVYHTYCVLILFYFLLLLIFERQSTSMLKYLLQLPTMPRVSICCCCFFFVRTSTFVKYVYLLYFNLYLDEEKKRKSGTFYLFVYVYLRFYWRKLCQRDFHLSEQTIYWKIFYVNSPPNPCRRHMSVDKINSIGFNRFSFKKNGTPRERPARAKRRLRDRERYMEKQLMQHQFSFM